MGKRSDFERRKADFYPTPRAAVVPLIPYLRASGVKAFAEPCCGEGDLVRHLESHGLRCVFQDDIVTGQDALALDDYGPCDAIITNPPWSRDILHRLITHFRNIAPTWLLLDADWAQTKQAAPYLPCCCAILSIGRVKWISDTKFTGKDNACWYKFDARHKSGPVFHWRDLSEVNPRRARACEQCRKAYEPQRSSSRFCSETCRQRAHRNRISVTVGVTAAPSSLSVTTSVTPTPNTETFRYVLRSDVPRFEAEGWQATPALDGTHHGEYSVLMRRHER